MADAITVSCPSCRTTFPVDPDKVPEGGVNARCSECQDIFRVEAPLEEVVPEFEQPGEVGPTETEELPGLDVSTPPEEEPVSVEEEAAAEGDEGFETGFDDYFTRTGEGPEAETATEEPPVPELPTLEEEEPEAEEAGFELEPDEAGAEPVEAEESFEAEVQPEESFEAAIETEESFEAEVETEEVEEEVETEAEGPEVETIAADLETAETDMEGAPSEVEAGPGTVETEAEPESAPVEKPRPTFGNRSPEEKAQRLARVLVSDMITYNPTLYETALARGSLKEDFAEEIEKSWEEYVEQVGDELANSTSYWTEALNDILAKGEQTF